MQRVYVLEQHVYGQHVLGLLEQNKLIEIIASTDGKKNPERTYVKETRQLSIEYLVTF